LPVGKKNTAFGQNFCLWQKPPTAGGFIFPLHGKQHTVLFEV
jgi:hypothetical protein